MFNLFSKKKPVGEKVVLRLSGLHCSSCSLTIDGELEDTPGVIRSSTSYATQVTTIEYDPTIVEVPVLKKVIESQGYQVLP